LFARFYNNDLPEKVKEKIRREIWKMEN
jgi:hypothetical protein